MNRLEGKTALITGASAGIGEACAHAFAQQGARVLLVARRANRLEALATILGDRYGVDAHAFPVDLTDRAGLTQLSDRLKSENLEPDVLVNNAGLAAGADELYSGDLDDWDRVIDTNVKGILATVRLFVPGMIERNSGHVVNVGSIAGHWVYPSNAVYIASKHAVRALTESLAIDLMGTDVRVTGISPGLVATDFSEARFQGDSERARKVYEGYTPLAPEDVADAIVYATNAPSHVNIADMLILPTDQRNPYLLHKTASALG